MSRATAISGSGTPERVTSIQIEPSLLYSLPDRVTDSVWLRPYIGSGATLRHHSVSNGTPGADSVSGNGFGLQAFGGTELTFAGAPQFAISADLSYHWFKTPVRRVRSRRGRRLRVGALVREIESQVGDGLQAVPMWARCRGRPFRASRPGRSEDRPLRPAPTQNPARFERRRQQLTQR